MRRLILVIVGALLCPGLCSPQTAQDSWENLKQLQVGQKIEVIDMNLKSVKGTFVSFSEDAISLRVGRDELAVQRANVMRVSVRDHSKRYRNMLLGVVIGGGAGLAADLGVDYGVRHIGGEGGTPIYTPLLAAVGAGAGAGLGAIPGHRTIYRTKKEQ